MKRSSLKDFLDNFKEVIWVVSTVIAVAIYVFSTFATQSALADKESDLKEYVDQKHLSVESRLDKLETVLERVDQRVYELHKRK